MQDFNAFSAYVTSELTRLYIDAENNQLINGAGVGSDMTGLLATPGILRPWPPTPGSTRWNGPGWTCATRHRSVGRAMYILHPANWSALRRTKDSTAVYCSTPTPPLPKRRPCGAAR